MATIHEQAEVARIVERLRRDHPDPNMRAELYADGRLPDYVRVLLPQLDDDAVLARIVEAVRAAEDGQPDATAVGDGNG